MNCRDVEPFLDQLVKPPAKLAVEQIALREHLATCSACQQALRLLTRWDAQLSVAMNEVSAPSGLSERLLSGLGEVISAELIAKHAAAQPRPRSRWSRAFTSVTIAGLLGLAVLLAWQFARRPMLSPQNVAHVLQQPIENLPVADASGSFLPRQWLALKGQLDTGSGKKMDLSELKLSLLVFPIDVRVRRGPPITGALLVVPRSRWKSAANVPVSQAAISRATVQYASPHVWIAWTEGNFVYLFALNGDAHLLEQLRNRLGGHDAYL